MKKVAIYARVSTKETQDYNRQISELKEDIYSHGYKDGDIEIYAETISGYKRNEERPQLQKLTNKIESSPKSYDCIYISEVSRLGRDPKLTRATIEKCTTLNVPIWIKSLNMRTLLNDGSRNNNLNIILQLLLEISDIESKTTKNRIRSGLLNSAINGKVGGGSFYPYGYTKDKNKLLVVDETELEVVKDIFRLYKEGYGIRAISNTLNEKNIPTRANKALAGKTMKIKNSEMRKGAESIRWSDKQIHDILNNPIYKGDRRYKDKLIPAPNIISPNLFDECQEVMVNKTHRNYLTTYSYLLKDIVICGCCGRNYFAKYKPVKGGDKVYICSSRLINKGNCGNAGLNINLIESAIYHQMINSETLLKYINSSSEVKKGIQTNIDRLTAQIKVDEKGLIEKEKINQKNLDLFYDNIISKTLLYNKKDQTDSEIKTLIDRLGIAKKELRKTNQVLKKFTGKKTSLKMLVDAKDNRNELQTIFKQFIEKIIINKVDAQHMLATIFVKINGVVLLNTLNLFLDVQGMRKKPKVYRYYSLSGMENNPVFKNNILVDDVNDIKKEVLSYIRLEGWVSIQEEYLLNIKVS